MWSVHMLNASRQRDYKTRSLCCQRIRLSPCWTPCNCKGTYISTSKETIASKFPKLFSGLGCLTEEYNIQLNKEAIPYALTTPQRVPLPLMEPVKKELQRMEREGVITKVEGPINWCAGMVVVPKANQKVRICVDLTRLNKNVQRERHILPSVDHTLAQFAEAHYFTKLDANSGFWQVPLSKKSACLTTFIMPFGRFCFNRMSVALEGLEGVACLMDDIPVHGKTKKEHDTRLLNILERLQKHGITLNKEKCSFTTESVKKHCRQRRHKTRPRESERHQ